MQPILCILCAGAAALPAATRSALLSEGGASLPTEGVAPRVGSAPESASVIMRGVPFVIVGLWVFLLTRTAASAANMSWRELLTIVGALVGYLVGNITMALSITHILKPGGGGGGDYPAAAGEGYPFPVMVSNFEMIGSFVTATLISQTGVLPIKTTMTPGLFVRMVLPVALAGSLARAGEAMSYMYLGLPMTQMLHPTMLIWTLVLAVSFGLEKLTWGLSLAVLLIVLGSAGTALGSYSYAQVMATTSLATGFACAFVSHLCIAGKATVTELSMQRMSFIDSVFWCNASMAVVGLLSAAVVEPRSFAAIGSQSGFTLGLALLVMLSGSLATFCSWYIVQRLGCMTLKVFSVIRGLFIIMASWGFFEDKLSALSYSAYAVSVVGIMRFHEAKREYNLGPAMGSEKGICGKV